MYLRKSKKEKQRTKVDNREDGCHLPQIKQLDLIVAILMSAGQSGSHNLDTLRVG